MKKIFCILIFITSFFSVANASSINLQQTTNDKQQAITNQVNDSTVIKKDKATAVFLAVTVGILGVHRFYLGTSTTTMIAYVLTFGGFGVITIIDIIQLIIADDISPFIDNPKFFMWDFEKNSEKKIF